MENLEVILPIRTLSSSSHASTSESLLIPGWFGPRLLFMGDAAATAGGRCRSLSFSRVVSISSLSEGVGLMSGKISGGLSVTVGMARLAPLPRPRRARAGSVGRLGGISDDGGSSQGLSFNSAYMKTCALNLSIIPADEPGN